MSQIRDRSPSALSLTSEEHNFLTCQVSRHRAPSFLSDRCQLILKCADGQTNEEIGAALGFHEYTVNKWRRRFQRDRLAGLLDEPQPSNPRMITDDEVITVIERTFDGTPVNTAQTAEGFALVKAYNAMPRHNQKTLETLIMALVDEH
ncbi:MAG: helix-turn-helix domain-containing protein [Kordiimonadaceae bacterium]|nr:helix-turn-helix domain-containing protein [Kordiimonadaceae bacterium]